MVRIIFVFLDSEVMGMYVADLLIS